MAPTRSFIVSLLALALLQAAVFAANCTDDEQTTVDNVYADLANSTACGDLISNSDATSLDYCMSSDCLSELSDAVDQLPDCTGDDEIDRKSGLQAIVTYCTNVTEVLNRSASASGSGGSAIGSGSTVSGASRGTLAAGVLAAQLSVALYVLAGFL